jgi:hypothetical protein
VTVVDIKMRLLIRLAPKAYFTSYIKSARNSVLICQMLSINQRPYVTFLESTVKVIYRVIHERLPMKISLYATQNTEIPRT